MSLSKYLRKFWTPDVGSNPHQPLAKFIFPYREFGKQKIVKRIPTFMVCEAEVVALRRGYSKAFCYLQLYPGLQRRQAAKTKIGISLNIKGFQQFEGC